MHVACAFGVRESRMENRAISRLGWKWRSKLRAVVPVVSWKGVWEEAGVCVKMAIPHEAAIAIAPRQSVVLAVRTVTVRWS